MATLMPCLLRRMGERDVTVRGKPQAKDSSIFVLDLDSGEIVDQISGIGPRACDVIFA